MIQNQQQQVENTNTQYINETNPPQEGVEGLNSSRTPRKLTNQQRQNAIFGPQKQVERHINATSQVNQIEQYQKNADELIQELSQQKNIIKDQIQILNDEIVQDNIDIFALFREKMNTLKQEFDTENKKAYSDQCNLEKQVLDLRKVKINLYENLGRIRGNFARNFDNIGYNQDDMQIIQNSLSLQDTLSPRLGNASFLQNQN